MFGGDDVCEWDKLFRHSTGKSECSFTAARATLQCATLRCSTPCKPGDVIRYRIKYVSGEKLAIGCILDGLQASIPFRVSDAYGGGVPGLASVGVSNSVAGDGTTQQAAPLVEPPPVGMSVRCDGTTFASEHFHILKSGENSPKMVATASTAGENEPLIRGDHDDEDSLVATHGVGLPVFFAPGQQVAMQIDRIAGTIHVGVEVGGTFRNIKVCSLPDAVEGSSMKGNYYFVIVKRHGEGVVELLKPTMDAVPIATTSGATTSLLTDASGRPTQGLLASDVVFGPRAEDALAQLDVLADKALQALEPPQKRTSPT